MQTVALYGSSLVLRSIGALLQNPAGLRVVQVDPTSSSQRAVPSEADVLVFDLTTAVPAGILKLWHAHPRLTLVGVDLNTHEAFVVSGERARVSTQDDLVRVIKGRAPDGEEC
jgi:hypothetical protein